MKTIKAIVERGTDGLYSVYTPEIAGIYGTGDTEEEAKESLNEAIEMAIEHVEETGEHEYYAPLLQKHSLEYEYDLSGFFKTYNYFDVNAFAKRIGMSALMMQHYKTGTEKASTRQKNEIFSGIYSVANELSAVKF